MTHGEFRLARLVPGAADLILEEFLRDLHMDARPVTSLAVGIDGTPVPHRLQRRDPGLDHLTAGFAIDGDDQPDATGRVLIRFGGTGPLWPGARDRRHVVLPRQRRTWSWSSPFSFRRARRLGREKFRLGHCEIMCSGLSSRRRPACVSMKISPSNSISSRSSSVPTPRCRLPWTCGPSNRQLVPPGSSRIWRRTCGRRPVRGPVDRVTLSCPVTVIEPGLTSVATKIPPECLRFSVAVQWQAPILSDASADLVGHGAAKA